MTAAKAMQLLWQGSCPSSGVLLLIRPVPIGVTWVDADLPLAVAAVATLRASDVQDSEVGSGAGQCPFLWDPLVPFLSAITHVPLTIWCARLSKRFK